MRPIFSECLLCVRHSSKVNKTDEGSILMSLINKYTKRIILVSDKYYEENK